MEKGDWKPHEKSMSLGRLASHVAEIPDWVIHTLTKDELNFKTGEWEPKVFKTTQKCWNTSIKMSRRTGA